MKKEGTYICAVCKGEFEFVTEEEDMIEEYEQLFGKNASKENMDIVCDDCWQLVKPDFPMIQ